MSALIYNTQTKFVYATYDTEKGARAALKRAQNRVTAGKRAKVGHLYMTAAKVAEAAVATYEEFNALDKMVTVRSLMTGAEVQIRESDRGGPCDPSTERYWSM